MALFKSKKKKLDSSAQAEGTAVEVQPSTDLRSTSAAPENPTSEPHHDSNKNNANAEEEPVNPQEIGEMLDPELIGRTITLARADDWEEDLIETFPKETQILYENQRGLMFFGKPYFSGKSLIQTLKFDPPPYQRTNTVLTRHPPKIDPSDPNNKDWPPDPERLYYSPYSPSTGILAMDSLAGHRWKWTQDRWYVDMRGEVDEEGWEYAFYWNGRYRWCGGNWHGKAVLIHGWVRRRRWVRGMHKIPPSEPKPKKEEDQVGKLGGGGYDGLFHKLRTAISPNDREKALKEFFDSALPPTMKELPDQIHRIYMLLDPLSTLDLIHILETHTSQDDPEMKTVISSALSYLTSKRDSIPLRRAILQPIRSLPETRWSTYTPPKPSPDQPTRRTRLRILRAQWRKSHQSPSQMIRKVHFSGPDPEDDEEFYNAPETMSRVSLGRSSSSESREAWFIAPETTGGEVERAKSVAGLIRDGKMSEEAIAEEQG